MQHLAYKFLVLTLFISKFTFSQNATISGFVKDVDGEPLPFVNVVSIQTSKGASTNMDGAFKFELPSGKHTLLCSFVGYQSDSVVVNLQKGQSFDYNFTLKPQANEIGEVEIIAIKKVNTESAVIREVMESKQVVNAVSAEMIEKTQDSDAAEVVKRVPGVTIVGNNFIMIRGLSERYNNVMLHDVFAPSMETDVKSFAFDIIPSGMIDRVMIYKSPAPDVTGEFAGGVVKIYTKSIPEKTSTSISLSTTYRNGSSFQRFLQPERSNMHWTGFNDKYNDLPDDFPEDIRKVNNNDIETVETVGRSLRNNWTPQEVNSLMDKSLSFTHAHKMKWGKMDVGNITAVTYSNNRTIFESERSDYNAYDHIGEASSFIYSFNDKQYTQNIRTGVLHNWAFRLNPNHTIELKNMFNVFSRSQYINRTGYDYEFNYAPNNHAFDHIYRGIYSGQLTGKHYFNKDNTKLTWAAGYGNSYRDQPDYKRFRTQIDTVSKEETLFIGVPISPNYLGRFYSEMRENSKAFNLALEQKIEGKKWTPLIKAGFFVEDKKRTFTARNIGYVQSNFMFFDQNLIYTTIDSLFMPENINMTTGIRIAEATNPSDSYDASNFLTAGYLGAELPFTKRLTLNAGLRVEYNVQQLNSNTLSGNPVIVNNPILSPLPSLNLSYFIVEDKTLIRAAYGKSVNRPEFRELAPFGFYDLILTWLKKEAIRLELLLFTILT
jgi:outer membrane receptor for Fe3+-dicitrate